MADVNPNPDEELELQQEEQETATGRQPDEQQEEQEVEISRDPVEQEQEQEEEQPVSRRESKRIKQLLDRFAERDEARFTRPQQRPQQRRGGQIIPEGEYDISEINEMAEGYGQNMYQRGLSEAQAYNIANTFATRLEIDAPRVNSRYTILDKESDDFNPGIAGFVNRMYLNSVGYDPMTGLVNDTDLRYGEFVDALMDALDLMSTSKVADSTKNVAGQAARTGIRPGGSRTPSYKGSDPKKMTDEQLDAKIAELLS